MVVLLQGFVGKKERNRAHYQHIGLKESDPQRIFKPMRGENPYQLGHCVISAEIILINGSEKMKMGRW